MYFVVTISLCYIVAPLYTKREGGRGDGKRKRKDQEREKGGNKRKKITDGERKGE